MQVDLSAHFASPCGTTVTVLATSAVSTSSSRLPNAVGLSVSAAASVGFPSGAQAFTQASANCLTTCAEACFSSFGSAFPPSPDLLSEQPAVISRLLRQTTAVVRFTVPTLARRLANTRAKLLNPPKYDAGSDRGVVVFCTIVTRLALHSRLLPGTEEAYEREHARVWPDLMTVMRAAGITDWSIWRSGRDLFHLVECDDYEAAVAQLRQRPHRPALAAAHGPVRRRLRRRRPPPPPRLDHDRTNRLGHRPKDTASGGDSLFGASGAVTRGAAPPHPARDARCDGAHPTAAGDVRGGGSPLRPAYREGVAGRVPGWGGWCGWRPRDRCLGDVLCFGGDPDVDWGLLPVVSGGSSPQPRPGACPSAFI